MTTEEIIRELKALDLKTANPTIIRALLEKFGNIMLQGIEIPIGDFIVRGVPGDNYRHYENKISYISDLSIPIRENRGTIEGRSGFYGLTTRGGEDFSYSICISECGTIFNNPDNDDIVYEEYVTMGKWRVIKPINVLAVVHKKDFMARNSELAELHESFIRKCHDFPEREVTAL